jgi:transcription termination/antitermination protein NusG
MTPGGVVASGAVVPAMEPGVVPELSSHRWYAVYTLARHEKAIARHFEERGLSCFLPLYQAIHRWNKRSSRVSLPLFPGYVFVRSGAQERHRPLQVPGVLRYVGPGAAPSPIADEEIEALRNILVNGKDVGPHPYLSAGQPVRVASGPLAGLCGIVQRSKSGNRFIISVEMIKQSISIELDGFQITSATQLNPATALLQAS